MKADILVMATRICMGHPASICNMVLERLDAELSESDEQGRLLPHGKVAVVGVVATRTLRHHTVAEVAQSLNHVGFTIPAAANDEATGQRRSKEN